MRLNSKNSSYCHEAETPVTVAKVPAKYTAMSRALVGAAEGDVRGVRVAVEKRGPFRPKICWKENPEVGIAF